jgi:hypothetical protein
MAKAKKRKAPGAARPAATLLVASKVRALIKELGFNTSGDALDGLNAYVAWAIEQAARRAHATNRRTVRPYDFMA